MKKDERKSFELLAKPDKKHFCFIGKTEDEAIQHANKFLLTNNLVTSQRMIETYFIAHVWIIDTKKKGGKNG